MAGFAIGVKHFMSKAQPYYSKGDINLMAFKKGYEEETFLQVMNVQPKGQVISECLFGVLNFPKKQTNFCPKN